MIKRIASYQPELYSLECLSHASHWTESMLRDCFSSDSYAVYGWFDTHENLKGFCIVQMVYDEFTLMNIVVHPDAQGQGIGGQLLNYLQALAASQPARLWLEVRASNQPARRLYKSCGFKAEGRRPNYYPLKDGREDAVIMSWEPNTPEN